METVARNATVSGQKDTGDCQAMFGETCVTDWVSALNRARMAATENERENPTDQACGGMALPTIPASCVGLFTLNTLATGNCTPNPGQDLILMIRV